MLYSRRLRCTPPKPVDLLCVDKPAALGVKFTAVFVLYIIARSVGE